ncbi:MAG: dTMP kinase [Armatimonadetes bacterium]|nr:dTMP kinase [Armatimonadota bacterium]
MLNLKSSPHLTELGARKPIRQMRARTQGTVGREDGQTTTFRFQEFCPAIVKEGPNVGGLLVTVEGVEGSGKTTVTQLLAEWLRQKGMTVTVTAEPGGTPIGAHIRKLLADFGERTAWAEAFLFLADRTEHVSRLIRPALERGEIVLCDRFTDSTIAYQAFGLGLPLYVLSELNRIATNGLVPDLTLLLDIAPEIGLQRVQNKTVFEQRDLHFHHRVRWGYLWLARQEPNRIKVVDASQPLEVVVSKAQQFVEEALRRWR